MKTPSAPPGIDLQPIELPVPAPSGADRWQLHVYAHTHWDREWYRTFERFRMQLVGMVDRLLHVLDADPTFTTFVLDGQTIVLEDYLELRPEELPRLRRLVAAGRIEIGPWYVLPDEFLVSGESLVRNLAEGRRVARAFGEPVAAGYLPDPFGHVAQMPAVLRGFGIDNVIFSRGMGDEFARTGSEFRWEAADGTDVLAIVQLSTVLGSSGYCNAETFGRGNGLHDEAPWQRLEELVPYLAAHDRVGLLLLAAGCDHETIQEQLPSMVARVREQVPGADVAITGLAAAIEGARAGEQGREAEGRPLERYRGELRGSLQAPILSSIFSARVPLKQANDALQVLLERHVEPLTATAVAAGVRPARDVEPFLRHAWRLVLQNHPHDSIGGCSVDLVHEEMLARSIRARETGEGLVEDLRTALGLGDVAVVHDAEGLGGIAARADGSAVSLRPGVPGRLLALGADAIADGAVVDGDRGIAFGDLSARIVERDGRSVLEVRDGDGQVVVDWIDEADVGDEYDFGAVAGDEPIRAEIVGWSTSTAGPGVAQLLIAYELALPGSIAEARRARSQERVLHRFEVRARVGSASPLVQLQVDFDNRADDHRLRMRVQPVGASVVPDRVSVLGHFAHVERPLRSPGMGKGWRQEPPGLDHCCGAVRLLAADDPGALALVAGRGHHEYEVRSTEAGEVLELTLLRSVGWLSRDDVVGRPGHAGPALATPGAQCRGAHRFDLAVGVGGRATFEAARAFLSPPLVLEPFGIGQSQHPAGIPGSEFPLESGAIARARDVLGVTPPEPVDRIERLGLRMSGEGVVPSACKLAEDGSGDLVVRWWAPAGSEAGTARLDIAAPVESVLRARLDETTLGPAPFADGACSVRVPAGGITTLRVRLMRP